MRGAAFGLLRYLRAELVDVKSAVLHHERMHAELLHDDLVLWREVALRRRGEADVLGHHGIGVEPPFAPPGVLPVDAVAEFRILRVPAGAYPVVVEGGLLTRDPRMKERKKYGLKAARRAPQFSKR